MIDRKIPRVHSGSIVGMVALASQGEESRSQRMKRMIRLESCFSIEKREIRVFPLWHVQSSFLFAFLLPNHYVNHHVNHFLHLGGQPLLLTAGADRRLALVDVRSRAVVSHARLPPGHGAPSCLAIRGKQ